MERYHILPITERYGGMEHRLYPVVLLARRTRFWWTAAIPDAPPLWRRR